jgi:enoyl-CoA hydratase/carnithine racemase
MVSIERRGRVAIVRFDRGDKANAMSRAAMGELLDAAQSFEDDADTSAIVLTGRPELFTLGADLKEPRLAAAGLAARRRSHTLGAKLCRAWGELEPMTIAAIEGWCVGGGAALTAACDLRVMAEGATIYIPEIERGMNLSWGSVPRLVSLVGPARAKRLVVLAERVGAARAREWGLADEVTPDGGALARALELAERIAELPPVQVRMCKEAVNAAAAALNHATSVMDRDVFLLAQSSADYQEGVRAFLERRKPNYTGG